MPQSAKEAFMFGRSYKGGQGALYSSVNFGFDTKDELKISWLKTKEGGNFGRIEIWLSEQ